MTRNGSIMLAAGYQSLTLNVCWQVYFTIVMAAQCLAIRQLFGKQEHGIVLCI